MADAAPAPPAPKVRKPSGAAVLLLAAAIGGAVGGGAAVVGAGLLGLGGAARHEAAAPLASPVEYIELDNSFTSNLTDTGRYLQLRLAVSTTGGAPVTAALAQHKLAVVSAVLAVLGELGEADIADRAAKDKLRGTVRTAINTVLRRQANVAGVDEVFFTSLVVQ